MTRERAIATVKEWQTLIAGISLALSIAYAATAVLKFSYNTGRAIQQHDLIIDILQQKCK